MYRSNIIAIFDYFLKRFNRSYKNTSFMIRRRAGYMVLLISIMMVITAALFFLRDKNKPTHYFFILVALALCAILILVLSGRFRIAQTMFWLLCLNEIFFICDKSAPDIIVIPEICAITFILLLVSTAKWHYLLIAVVAVFLTGFRLFIGLTNPVLNAEGKENLIIGYSSLIAIFICLYIVGLILIKSFQDRESLIKEQKEKLEVFEKLESLKKNLKEKEKSIVKIQDRLHQDELTNLFNRRAFYDLYKQYISSIKKDKKTSTLTFIDLDQLKYINDNFGHDAGDEYIHSIAAEIQSRIRDEDYAFRFGGDEFIIIFDKCSMEQSELILERINAAFSARTEKLFEGFSGSFSHGSVLLDSFSGVDPKQTLKEADALMIKDKNERRIIRGEKNSKIR